MNDDKKLKIIFKIITIFVTIILVLFVLYGIHLGIFKDKMILVSYMRKFGLFGPVFFIFLQIFQVVFPVIPGGASCFAGVLSFGSVLGFIYNYIGLVIGSVCAFYLSRKYGIKLIYKLFCKDTIEKYLKYIQDNRFEKIFFWGIFLPGFPDDLLCYIAGISNISFKRFLWIIIIGKPFALIMYSLFMNLL